MITARLAKNKHESEFFINGHRVEVEEARVEYIGKRQMLVLMFSDFKLLPESRCPERGRYEKIMQAFGNEEAVKALQPTCSLIKLNSKACDGCRDRPI